MLLLIWASRLRRCASPILDIFEGTQAIQLLIIARLLLGKTSAELR
jgi:alkylation response protein AidB-like acyl-CoA dehydrogenase